LGAPGRRLRAAGRASMPIEHHPRLIRMPPDSAVIENAVVRVIETGELVRTRRRASVGDDGIKLLRVQHPTVDVRNRRQPTDHRLIPVSGLQIFI
jgi:hypothetical protein